MESVKISELVADVEYGMQLQLVGKPQGLDGHVNEIQIHKLGLLLTGIKVSVHPNRLQILGRSENTFLKHLDAQSVSKAAGKLIEYGIRHIVITRKLKVPDEFTDPLLEAGVCLLTTPLSSEEFMRRAANFLMDKLASRVSVHGVLIDVFGVGVLLVGKGGIGKSECALDLVHRGHRLVADDLVELIRLREAIVGQCSPVIRHHMEIRGLGIINIQDLYGIAAVRDRKKVDLVIELVAWSRRLKLYPLGVEEDTYVILGVTLPHIKLPVLPGKNLSVIVEVAARNHLLKVAGHDSAKEFQKKLSREIAAFDKLAITPGEEVE